MDYSALEFIPEPMLVIDEQYKVLFANKRARELYGENLKACYEFTHSFEKPCHEQEGQHPCPIKRIKDLGIESSGVVHVHDTKEGKRYFYVIASYVPQERVYIEMHIDLLNAVEQLKLIGQRPEFVFPMGPIVFFEWRRAEGWPVLFVSPNVENLLGYTPEDFLSGRVCYVELIHPDDLERVAQEVAYHTEKKSPFWTHADYRLKRKDGVYIWVTNHTVPILNEAGEIRGYYGYIADATEKHTQEEFLYTLSELNPNGLLVYDHQANKVIYANKGATLLLGYTKEKLLAHESLTDLIHWKDRHKFSESIKMVLEGNLKEVSDRLRIYTKSGKTIWIKYTMTTFYYKGKRVLIITMVNISEEIKRERLLVKLATKDQLTGVRNRRAMIGEFERLIAQAERGSFTFSIILFDVDNFKQINDTYGHIAGDHVLKDIAKIVGRVIRKSDIFGRWGGEEFLLILPMTPDPRIPAEKIRQAIESYEFYNGIKTTISLGATTYVKGDTIDSMLSRADEALYMAKAQGKNKVVIL